MKNMKKIIFYLLITLVISLVSCKSSIERKAEKQLHNTLYSLAKNPDPYKINSSEVKYQTDSLCIIHCNCSGQNGFGGYTRSTYEYIYMLGEDGAYENLRDLDEKKSIFYYSDLNNLSKNDSVSIECAAIIYCMMDGRKVPNK